MKKLSITGKINKFPGKWGWYYIAVPKKYTQQLKQKRKQWGMFPITAKIKNTEWKTKLMTKKGGDYIVAIKSDIRVRENIYEGDKIKINISLH